MPNVRLTVFSAEILTTEKEREEKKTTNDFRNSFGTVILNIIYSVTEYRVESCRESKKKKRSRGLKIDVNRWCFGPGVEDRRKN